MSTIRKDTSPSTTLFVDVGCVLLKNGCDHLARKRAAKHFAIEWAEMEVQHSLTFELHEEGRLTFDDYLGLVVFNEKHAFTRSQFRNFICGQSRSFPRMLELVKKIKKQYGLKVVVVSNESREINASHFKEFNIGDFVDSFVSSCFVGFRKLGAEIFRLALDLVGARPEQIIYLENTPMFFGVSGELGIRSILHTGYKSTSGASLDLFSLRCEEEDYHANT